MEFSTKGKADNFFEFLDCLSAHTARYCSRSHSSYFINYVIDYYGGISELNDVIDRLNADEMYKIIKTLLNNKGEQIFNEEEIDILIDAKEFALSNDPKKRVNYLCTIEIEFLLLSGEALNSDEPFKIVATVKVNCISNDYLKMSENNDEYYTSYLFDIAEKKLMEKYTFLGEAMEMAFTASKGMVTDYKLVNE